LWYQKGVSSVFGAAFARAACALYPLRMWRLWFGRMWPPASGGVLRGVAPAAPASVRPASTLPTRQGTRPTLVAKPSPGLAERAGPSPRPTPNRLPPPQLTSPVQWETTLKTLLEKGLEKSYEVGGATRRGTHARDDGSALRCTWPPSTWPPIPLASHPLLGCLGCPAVARKATGSACLNTAFSTATKQQVTNASTPCFKAGDKATGSKQF
jgi:hypothetical protein